MPSPLIFVMTNLKHNKKAPKGANSMYEFIRLHHQSGRAYPHQDQQS